MRFPKASARQRPWTFGLILLSLLTPTASAQGPAPETAPPLFPGGGLISYNSIFTTRGPIAIASGNIPVTARSTFTHEGDFNFTWGFYRDFDLTVLLPVVTNHYDAAGNGGIAVRGTGVGDAMVLVKYRFYRRDSLGELPKHPLRLAPSFRPATHTCAMQLEIACPRACSPVRAPPISSSRRTGLTPGSSVLGAL